MGLLDSIFGAGANGVGDLITKIVGTFHLSPQAQLEFNTAMAANAEKLAELNDQIEIKELDASSGNIQSEEKSGDKFTARARPTFLYIMEAILGWNYILVPIWHQAPITLPDSLFWLFGSCMLGYTGARSWEKISGIAGK